MREYIEVTEPADAVILLLLYDQLCEEAVGIMNKVLDLSCMLNDGVSLCLVHFGVCGNSG